MTPEARASSRGLRSRASRERSMASRPQGQAAAREKASRKGKGKRKGRVRAAEDTRPGVPMRVVPILREPPPRPRLSRELREGREGRREGRAGGQVGGGGGSGRGTLASNVAREPFGEWDCGRDPVEMLRRQGDRGAPKAEGSWARFEGLLPSEPWSLCGHHLNNAGSTLPLVRTIIGAEVHQRSTSRRTQAKSDSDLALPRQGLDPGRRRAPLRPPGQARAPQRGYPRQPKKAPPALPVVRKRPTAPARRLAQEEAEAVDANVYWETPFNHAHQEARVFQVSDYVSKERAIITAGRTNAWELGRARHMRASSEKRPGGW